MKIDIPCAYINWNERLGKDESRRPAVDCDLDCKHCGWNPEVAKKRIEKTMTEHRCAEATETFASKGVSTIWGSGLIKCSKSSTA